MREAGDFNWDLIRKAIGVHPLLISLGTQADEFEEAGGGAEDDAADQEPRLRAEPPIDQPAQRAKGDHRRKECDAGGISVATLAILILVWLFRHNATNFRE